MKTPSPATLEALFHALDYDPATGEIRWRETRRRVTEGDLAGSISRDGNIVIGFNGTSYQAHHIAWFMITGRWPNTPILFRDKNPNHLWADNIYAPAYERNSKANYMRGWRSRRKHARALEASRRLNVSDVPGVHFGVGGVWSVRDRDNFNLVIASFATKAEAETYGRMLNEGRHFIAHNPPEIFTDIHDPRNRMTAGAPGTLTYEQANLRFAYDPSTGAIYRRTSPSHNVDFTGAPAIELDDTRRPIVRASGRTYSAGMLAWFLHTGGEWPKRKQLGYRDGNRKNTRWANLYLKGE